MGVATEDTEIIAEKYHSTRSALDHPMITDYWFPDRRGALLIAFPRIRAVRLESLLRARRGGPRHPARKPIQFTIADTRRTQKSVCPLLPGRAAGN